MYVYAYSIFMHDRNTEGSLQVWWVFPLLLFTFEMSHTTGSGDRILPASDQARRVRHFVLADCVGAVSCGKNGMLVFRNAETSPSQLVRTITHFGEQWILAGAMKLGCLFVE